MEMNQQQSGGNLSSMAPMNGVAGGAATRLNDVEQTGATVEAGSGSSAGNSNNTHERKKRRLQRLNKEQSEIIEGFFCICGHPDEGQKRHLSQATGLGLDQVKFWFQNKRTQVKTTCWKEDNYKLTVENEILRDENRRIKIAHCYAICLTCRNSAVHNQLAAEMERIKGQTEWLQQEIARSNGANANLAFQLDSSAENLFSGQHDHQMIAELAKNAMHGLIILAEAHVALWLPVPGYSFETLNMTAYQQAYPGGDGANALGFRTEATRADAMVMMDHKSIVDFLMDPYSYRTFFPGVISGAVTNRIYSWPTNDGYNGVIQLMTVEMMFPSPLVPTRKCTFLRYCKVLEEGAVVVVDVSLDNGSGLSKCRKMPSGFLIRSVRPNACKVAAIEHVRVDDTGIHELYQPCLDGLIFGARRWVATMARQSARLRDVYLSKTALQVSTKGRKNLMKLADDLLASYASSVSATGAGTWTVVIGAGTEKDVRVAYRGITEGSSSTNAVLSVSASLRLPLPMRKIFDLLRNLTLRSKWDVLVHGSTVKEEVSIARGVGSDDAVTVLHVKRAPGENKERTMILQNNGYDVSGSFIVYSPIDSKLMDTMVLGPSELPSGASGLSLYPTGFSLLPDGEAARESSGMDLGDVGGTLMTLGFQIPVKLATGNGMYPRSVTSAIRLMTDTIGIMKRTLMEDHSDIYGSGPFNA
ncbi:homeobox-leucine zipper protein TF1 [Oryza brachyantha]|uniref:homeobox-leucine zipper protein TF1 n=1 Tax=Oryza brachyantha TaxID=4533 RepID=UPI0003EADB83|nr:homeobox-leucine zipper protein TF1 [Oryza brachyantha]